MCVMAGVNNSAWSTLCPVHLHQCERTHSDHADANVSLWHQVCGPRGRPEVRAFRTECSEADLRSAERRTCLLIADTKGLALPL